MPGRKLKLGGKHKRGERGSVEEEQTCKRSNMASEESESVDEETMIITEAEEPTHLELIEMLVDIKIEPSNIVQENNKLANEMAGLGNTIQEQKVELDSLKTLIIKLEKENTALETDLSVARKRIDEQEEELAELYPLQFNNTQDNNLLRLGEF